MKPNNELADKIERAMMLALAVAGLVYLLTQII